MKAGSWYSFLIPAITSTSVAVGLQGSASGAVAKAADCAAGGSSLSRSSWWRAWYSALAKHV
ncbi:MAG: hypothetical protein ACRDPY_48165 [Streptosporangiaceae bacterium]